MGGPVEKSHHALNHALRTRAETPHGDGPNAEAAS
jgi:hypothetical protein